MDDNNDNRNVFSDAAAALASVKDLVVQGEAVMSETRNLAESVTNESKAMLEQLSDNFNQMRAMHGDILAARQDVVTVAGQVNEAMREGARHRDEVFVEIRRTRRQVFSALLGVTVSLLALIGVSLYYLYLKI